MFGVLVLRASPAILHRVSAESELVEKPLGEVPGSILVGPAQARGRPGVVVLSGSSGRIERNRARLLADAGAVAVAVGYFGGPAQPLGICEVPLETITTAVDALLDLGCSPIGLVGASKGAEAALLVAQRHPRVQAVVALAPPSVVWANVGPGLDGAERPLRSSWTWQGEPLEFVPYDPEWKPDRDPPAFRGLYEASLERYAEAARRAAISVHARPARLVLAAGGDDQVWPSDRMAAELVARRDRALHTEIFIHPEAGHRVILPGETAAEGGMAMARGGNVAGDTELGQQIWPSILHALALE